MGESLIRWIFQPKSINTGSEKKRFTTFFFLGGGLQGAVYQIQKSLIMAALAARCHLIRMGLVSLDQNCNFYRSQPVARIVSDDNNRIQFLRSEWNNKVLVYVSWTFMSPPLQKEARLFSSFQFFVPKYTLKERENWWHKIFFSNINTRCLNISNSSILSNHLSEIFLSSKVAHLLEPVFAFASHTCESAKAQSLSAILEKYFYCACVSLFPCIYVGRVNSLPFPFTFTFAFAFASHVWTSLQNCPWNDILIITELNTFSTENWQCFLYDEPFCLHFIKKDK